MKICLITKSIVDHVLGGMEVHIRDLANGLAFKGVDVHIITSKITNRPSLVKNDSVTYYFIDAKPRFFREKYYYKVSKFFQKLDKKENFDVVHSQSVIAAGLIRYAKYKGNLIVTSHGTAMNEIRTILEGRKKWNSFLTIPFFLKSYLLDERPLYKRASSIIAVSPTIKQNISDQHNIPIERIQVVLNSIDKEKFSPQEKRPVAVLRGFDSGKETILVSVGNIRRIKGYQYIIEMMHQYNESNLKLIMVGEGADLKWMKNLAKTYNLENKIFFAGKVSDSELIEIYNTADIFILPSVWHSEAFGIVNIEAMACGLPVLASRIGGIPDVVEDGKTGLLFKPGDISDMIAKVQLVQKNSKLRAKLIENGLATVEKKYTLNKMVLDTLEIYNSLKNEE